VPAAHPQLDWLRGEFAAHLASVFETMAGERPTIGAWTESDPAPDALFWHQPFTTITGELWLAATEPMWTLGAQQILHAAGMDDADRETLESTYVETIGQALSGVAQAITGRLGREVTPSAGQKGTAAPSGVAWSAVELKFAGGAVTIYLGPEAALLEAIDPPAKEIAERESGGGGEAAGSSKTFDLLLDVEMPVSVSFGRASVPLKDVLKLTTGSIVELNRSIVEPVEVIVNNCVVARGEVVVIEGNFGVRIQQVVSRQERLRTLN
jgi:flagellar motor switch protein FliN/FliY